MKFFIILFLVIILAGCQKTGGSVKVYQYTPDPPKPYGLWLEVDTLDFTFSTTQVTFNAVTYDNTDYSTKDLRPLANDITFTANDGARSFSMHLNMVDLMPGDYILDGRNGFYYFTYDDWVNKIQYVKEPYYGYAVYTDSTGTYSAGPDVLFTTLNYSRAVGQFSGFMTNSKTHARKYISGDF